MEVETKDLWGEKEYWVIRRDKYGVEKGNLITTHLFVQYYLKQWL